MNLTDTIKVISPEEFLSASGVFEAIFHTKQ